MVAGSISLQTFRTGKVTPENQSLIYIYLQSLFLSLSNTLLFWAIDALFRRGLKRGAELSFVLVSNGAFPVNCSTVKSYFGLQSAKMLLQVDLPNLWKMWFHPYLSYTTRNGNPKISGTCTVYIIWSKYKFLHCIATEVYLQIIILGFVVSVNFVLLQPIHDMNDTFIQVSNAAEQPSLKWTEQPQTYVLRIWAFVKCHFESRQQPEYDHGWNGSNNIGPHLHFISISLPKQFALPIWGTRCTVQHVAVNVVVMSFLVGFLNRRMVFNNALSLVTSLTQ